MITLSGSPARRILDTVGQFQYAGYSILATSSTVADRGCEVRLAVHGSAGTTLGTEALDTIPGRLLRDVVLAEVKRGRAAGARTFRLLFDEGSPPPLEIELEEFLGLHLPG